MFMCRLFSASSLCQKIISFVLLYVFSLVVNSATLSKNEHEIYKFGPGVHEIDSIVLKKKHAVIEGEGFGVTILKIKNGIWATAPRPIIRNLSIVGEGKGIGIRLSDTWSAKIQDVEIVNFGVGIKFELTKKGRESAKGKTFPAWPSPLEKGEHWGSRITLSEIRGIEISGSGDGIVFENQLKHSDNINYWRATDENLSGEFMNATTIWGGHIVVKGRAIVIGDGVGSTKVFGTYIDVSPAGGIVMEHGARGLTLIGVSLDPIRAAYKAETPLIVAPKRAKKSIQMIGMSTAGIRIKYK